MKITAQQYAQALYDSVQQTSPKDHDLVMDNFVKILASNGDLSMHGAIESEYKRIDMKARGLKEAEVTVARDMEINSALVSQLNEIIGSKVEVKSRIDDSIVGGVIVKVDDMLIDASVKAQINNLKDILKS